MLAESRKKAFTLIELLVVIAIIALLIGILLPALGQARLAGRKAVDLANQKQMATATSSYASEVRDGMNAFTVQAGRDAAYYNQVMPDDPSVGLNAADLRAQAAGGTDLAAASAQAVYILRKRGDRTDIQAIDSWIPHVLYTHLVLQDYLASRLPERLVVSPQDKVRLAWQADPKAFDRGEILPAPSGAPGTNEGKRWPYSSSYEYVPASYSPDRGDAPNFSTVTQAGQHRMYQITNAARSAGIMGRRRLSDVAFPSQKVMLYDSSDRYSGKLPIWYAFPTAAPIMTMFDMSVGSRRTGAPQALANPAVLPEDANEGVDPALPTRAFALQYTYTPELWESPIPGGATTANCVGFYRWTRGGLKGIDFGGREVVVR